VNSVLANFRTRSWQEFFRFRWSGIYRRVMSVICLRDLRISTLRANRVMVPPGMARRCYCSFAYSALACFRMGVSGSASFQSAKKSW
jgi:hypothetical protein